MKDPKRITEKKIEAASKRWARNDGWLVFKFSSPQQRGVPDDVFVKDGCVVWIEYKKPGGKLTDLQRVRIEQLRKHGATVEIAYSVEDTKRILRRAEKRAKRMRLLWWFLERFGWARARKTLTLPALWREILEMDRLLS